MVENEKETLIDRLLVFLNDELESKGQSIKIIQFHLQETGADAKKFLETRANYTYQDLALCLNVCLTREYLIHLAMVDKYTLGLSLKGQARALSVKLAKPKNESVGGNIQIGVMNNHGAAQIGNNNTQNIEIVLKSIMEAIEKADASEAEKAEVKSRFAKFIEHPLTNSVIGAASTIFSANLGK